MDNFARQVDELCASIPGLQKVADASWTNDVENDVSFPLDAHSDLATVEPKSYWFRHRNAIIAEVVRRFPPAGPILDIGGGNGFVSLGLTQAGFPSVVVEPGVDGAAIAASRGLPVIRSAFQDLKLGESMVDAVGLFDVLEHIEDDEGTLAHIHRNLRPDGMCYIAVPAFNFLWSDEDVRGGHFRRYTAKALAQKMTDSGFEVQYTSYLFSMLILPMFALRSLLPALAIGGKARVTRSKTTLENMEKEHTLPQGAVGKVLQRSFDRELEKVRAGGRISFGTSCLVVGRKA